ncbi:MAG: hypothetical protein ACK5OX_11655 [Desertimonas sp.]
MRDLAHAIDRRRSALAATSVLARTTLVSALVAFGSHLAAFVLGAIHHGAPWWSWLVMMLADVTIAGGALMRPDRFQLRRFALPAVLAISTNLIVLAPLPWVGDKYQLVLPVETVPAVAAGVIVMWLTLTLTPTSLAGRAGPGPAARRRRRPLVVVGIIVAAVAVFPLWLRTLDGIPLLRLVGGGGSVTEDRQRALRELDSGALRLAVGTLRNVYLGFAAAWCTADWIRCRRDDPRRARRSLFVLTIVVAIAASFSLVTTERSLLGQLVLACAVAGVVATARGRLTGRMTAGLVAAGLAFPLFVGLLVTSGSPLERLGAATAGLRRRILYLPSDVMLHYFTAFPATGEHIGLSGTPKLSRLATGEPFNLPGYIYDVYYRRELTVAGNANGSFIGVGWANFGSWGVVLWCAMAGIGVVLLEGFVRRRGPRAAAALRGVFVVQLGLLTQADLFRSVLSIAPGVLDLVIVVWLGERVLSRRRDLTPAALRWRQRGTAATAS